MLRKNKQNAENAKKFEKILIFCYFDQNADAKRNKNEKKHPVFYVKMVKNALFCAKYTKTCGYIWL